VPRLTRALRLLLAVALLCAQQVALGHAVGHAAKQDASPVQQLCSFHSAMDTVAGAMDCALPEFAIAAPETFSPQFVVLPSAPLVGIVPASRGPPSAS